MTEKSEKYFYTWEEFDADVKKIAEWAAEKDFKNIYGIPRGGLVLAIALSHRIGIPMIFHPEDIFQGTLVVDDISDSGKTLAVLGRRMSFKPRVATIFRAGNTVWVPDFSLRVKDSWVIFPWEIESSSRYDGTKL